MPIKKKITWKEQTELCELLMSNEIKVVAQKLGITVGAVYNRLNTLRDTLEETQASINRIRTLQRISPRVRKFTTKGNLRKDAEEDE